MQRFRKDQTQRFCFPRSPTFSHNHRRKIQSCNRRKAPLIREDSGLQSSDSLNFALDNRGKTNPNENFHHQPLLADSAREQNITFSSMGCLVFALFSVPLSALSASAQVEISKVDQH